MTNINTIKWEMVLIFILIKLDSFLIAAHIHDYLLEELISIKRNLSLREKLIHLSMSPPKCNKYLILEWKLDRISCIYHKIQLILLYSLKS